MNEFNFPETVRAYLGRTGKTQRELAKNSGVHEVTLSKILTGATEASGATIRRLWPLITEPSPPPPDAPQDEARQ